MNRNPLTTTLTALAGLLEYPDSEFESRLGSARVSRASSGVAPELSSHTLFEAEKMVEQGFRREAENNSPGACAPQDDPTPALARFCTAISLLTPDEREELYTGTFDVTPACVAYVSIHLFGEENFKRGEFMAGLHARYQQAGFNPAGELPDHLAILLRYTAHTDEAERRELVEFCLLGPIGKMIAALNASNPYRALLEAVRDTLQVAYPDVKPALSPVDQMRQHGAGCATVSAGCGCDALTAAGESSPATAAILEPAI